MLIKFVLRSFILEKNCVELKNTLDCAPAFCCQKELCRGLRFLDWKGQGEICFREMSWWVGSWEGVQQRFGNDYVMKKVVNETGSFLVFLVPLVIIEVCVCFGVSDFPCSNLFSLFCCCNNCIYAVFLLKWCSFFFFFSPHVQVVVSWCDIVQIALFRLIFCCSLPVCVFSLCLCIYNAIFVVGVGWMGSWWGGRGGLVPVKLCHFFVCWNQENAVSSPEAVECL